MPKNLKDPNFYDDLNEAVHDMVKFSPGGNSARRISALTSTPYSTLMNGNNQPCKEEVMPDANFTPETELGHELQDIAKVMAENKATPEEVRAALMGRVGVSSSCWSEFIDAEIERRKPIMP
jgi:hypothetical protein